MPLNWSFKRNFTGAKEIKDTNDYLSKVGRAIGSLDYMPVGFNMPWWSDTLPSNKYMFMEGQSLASYPEARAVFGDYLPDLRDRVLVHKGSETEFNAIKKMGGEKAHTLTYTEAPTGQIYTDTGFKVSFNSGGSGDTLRIGYVGTDGSPSSGSLIVGGGNQPHNNLQPYIVCRYIAKVLP